MTPKRRWTIAVDFDGVIHRYSKGWRDGTIYDPPVEGAREALARIHARYEVVIFTTRVNPAMRGAETQLDRILAWLEDHAFRRGEHFDEITQVKPALAYIDDRAVRFTTWGATLDELAELHPLPLSAPGSHLASLRQPRAQVRLVLLVQMRKVVAGDEHVAQRPAFHPRIPVGVG
jgi:hypothetical protein